MSLTPPLLLLIPLHNPMYPNTRHSIAHLFLQTYLKQYRKSAQIQICVPTSPMNLNGYCANKALRKWNAKVEDVVVIHDDLDKKLGEIALKSGGGAG